MSLDNPIARYTEGARLAPLPANELKTALRALAHAGDADDPLVFVGRRRELERIIYTAEPLLSGNLGRRRTLLFQGAPGSGKTVLVREAARRLEALGVAAIVKPELPDGPEVEALYRDLADHLTGTAPDDHRVTKTITGSVRGGVPGLLGGEVVEGRTVSPRPTHSSSAIRALASGRAWGPTPAVAVLVDEIQNIGKKGVDSPVVRLVRDLHTQDAIPVLMVLSGLSDSGVELELAGASRVNRFRVNRLSAGEARECLLESALRAVRAGVECADRDALGAWAKAAAAVSDGWPRHLQNELLALWDTLYVQETPSFDVVDFDAVRREGDARRDRYYADRLTVSGLPAAALHPLCEAFAVGRTPDESGVELLVDEGIGRLPPFLRKKAAALDPRGKGHFRRLLHAGIVSLDDEGWCVSPIPSMVDYILRRAQGLR